jgi:hypothetical protein
VNGCELQLKLQLAMRSDNSRLSAGGFTEDRQFRSLQPLTWGAARQPDAASIDRSAHIPDHERRA